MFKKWIQSSLQRKLSVIMLLSTLLPLLSLGGFTYYISSKITQEKLIQSGRDALAKMDANLKFMVNDIENTSIFLIGQEDIQFFLRSPERNELLHRKILNLIDSLVVSKDYLSNITIHIFNSNAFLSQTRVYESALMEQIDFAHMDEKTWSNVYRIRDYTGEHNVFSFVRPVRSIYSFDELGWLAISFDEEVVSQNWTEPGFGDNQGSVALLNEEGMVLSSTNKEWLGKPMEQLFPGISDRIHSKEGYFTYESSDSKETVLYARSSIRGWTLVGTIPYELHSSQNGFILQLTAVAVVITILINIGLVLYMIHRVTNPLQVLARLFTKVNPEGPMPVYKSSTNDEIGRLGEVYNKLGRYIRELKEQLILEETRKKEADMRALQAQINPHFLYNTLSSIHWMALMKEEKQIADMVGSLSDFLQFSLNKGSDYCSVYQEFAHIQNYMQIQSIRYPDKFELELSMDSALRNKKMLKLLLQPLLENAMIHGIQKKEGKGLIGVYAEQMDDWIYFTVIDDGVGMSEERLAAIQASLRKPITTEYEEGSYGLRNVNERLRLHYGPGSQLCIESKTGAGTRISFSIPLKEGSS